MKKLIVFVALLMVTMGLSASVQADPVAMKLTGLNGTIQNGFYVGPAYGTVNGTPTMMICIDFAHNVSVGQQWTATTSNYTDLSTARFASAPDALANYQQAAWLFDQLSLNPAETGNLQFAMWGLFTPSTPVSSGAIYWMNLAKSQNLSNYDFSRFRIYTPTDGSAQSPQEFLARVPGSEVPEPASLLLLGSGLAGIATLLKKRGKKTDL